MSRNSFLNSIDHRPWPLPQRRWTFFQSWQNILFLHYRVDSSLLRRFIPAPLEIDEFDGSAWVGVVPFYLVVRPRGVPGVPRVSFFPEINVRTYVEYEGKKGVWFVSCDARNPLAVWAAQKFFHINYFQATMSMRRGDESVEFSSKRKHSTVGDLSFDGRYRPTGETFLAQPGTIEHFFCERYCLYAESRRRGLLRIDVHHAPWALQPAEVTLNQNTMLRQIEDPELELHPSVLYSRGVDCAIWPIDWLNGSK